MHRTTVYLPDDLRDRLARAAKEDRRSEADLIREGVEQILRERALRRGPPAPRTPLVDSGRPELGLALDWLFADAPDETLNWLVREATSVWAQQLEDAQAGFTFRLEFRGPGDGRRWTRTAGRPGRIVAATWSEIWWSLARWQAAVMDGRRRREGDEVLVLLRHDVDQPPEAGAPATEVARVEVGPRLSTPLPRS